MCDGWGEVMKQPCKPDCPERSAVCHSVCPKWAIFERWKQAEYKRRAAVRGVDEVYFDGKERSKMKNYKKTKEWRWK